MLTCNESNTVANLGKPGRRVDYRIKSGNNDMKKVLAAHQPAKLRQ
jgi:hypothetical protein